MRNPSPVAVPDVAFYYSPNKKRVVKLHTNARNSIMKKRSYQSSKLKSALVLELLRGEDIEEISRREKISVSDLHNWRNEFIKSGEQGFKRNPEESKLTEAQRLIGQLQMELELRKKKSELLANLKGK
jgi:transposase